MPKRKLSTHSAAAGAAASSDTRGGSSSSKRQRRVEQPRNQNFDVSSYAWRADVDYESNPLEYRVGEGEQGVLICQPFKSRIGQHWRFATVEKAKQSSAIIYNMFLQYLDDGIAVKDSSSAVNPTYNNSNNGSTSGHSSTATDSVEIHAVQFVAADLARKYLQMGYTRARRYCNYRGGRKYTESGDVLPRGTGDSEKAKCASLYYEKWQLAESHARYKRWKVEWKQRYG